MAKIRKVTIPKALREQVWLKYCGTVYETKCYISWCTNQMTVFNYQVGHDLPESKGGTLDIDNLRPLCSRCNVSMSNNYTIQEWNKLSKEQDTEILQYPIKTKRWWCFCG